MWHLIWVVEALHPVADAHDELAVLLGVVHEVHGDDAGVEGLGEHAGRFVQGSSKPEFRHYFY